MWSGRIDDKKREVTESHKEVNGRAHNICGCGNIDGMEGRA